MARTLTNEQNLSRRQAEYARELASLRRIRFIELSLAALFLLGGAIWKFALGGPDLWPIVLGAALLFIAVGQAVRQRETADEASDSEEVRVLKKKIADLLDEKLANDHYILNDLRLQVGREKCWIDHLVVAPSGMFVVNTVAWDGEIFGDPSKKAYEWKIRTADGRVRPARNPVGRALRERRILCNWLKGTNLVWERVFPVVVFANPEAKLNLASTRDRLMTPEQLVNFINDFCFEKPVLSNSEVEKLANGLNQNQPH